MADQYNFTQGTYRLKVKRLNVRGTPDSEQTGNLVGYQLTQGKEFPVYGIEFDKKGFPWGIITPPGAPQAHYVCLWDGNTLFAELVSSAHDWPPREPSVISREWAAELDTWARKQGYKGVGPF
jgi:hypothetical protein